MGIIVHLFPPDDRNAMRLSLPVGVRPVALLTTDCFFLGAHITSSSGVVIMKNTLVGLRELHIWETSANMEES